MQAVEFLLEHFSIVVGVEQSPIYHVISTAADVARYLKKSLVQGMFQAGSAGQRPY